MVSMLSTVAGAFWLALALSVPGVGALLVTDLNEKNFDTLVTKASTLWLIKFYAPWCSHCKRLAPVMEEVASEIAAAPKPPGGTTVGIGKVDCTVETKLCKKWEIKGYPTMYITQNGDKWDFDGKRTRAGIHAIIERMKLPAVTDLSDSPNADELLPPPGDVRFLFGRGASDVTVHEAFAKAARSLQHALTFYAAGSASALEWLRLAGSGGGEEMGVSTPFLAKLERGEEPVLLYGNGLLKASEGDLRAWMRAHRFPVLSVIEQSNFPALRSDPRMLALAVVDLEGKVAGDAGLSAITESEAGALAKVLREFAHNQTLQTPGKFLFGVLDGSKWLQFLEEVLQTTRDELPRLIVLTGSMASRGFILGEARSTANKEAIGRFLTLVAKDKLHIEYQGMWGLPDRWWHFFKRRAPQLGALDGLPPYIFAAPLLLAVAGLVVALLCWPLAPPKLDKMD